MEMSLDDSDHDRSLRRRVALRWLPIAAVIACFLTAALLVTYLQIGKGVLRPTDPVAARRWDHAIAMPRYLGVLEAVGIVSRYPGSREAEAAAKFIVQNCDHLGWSEFERLTGRHVPVLPEDDFPLGLVRNHLREEFERRGVAEF